MKQSNLHNKVIGKKGEDIGCVFLTKHNFKIVERNHLKKWGEIDIIAERHEKIHFIEVKTVSCESILSVTHVTNNYRPEDNVHFRKKQRLSRVFQTYLIDKKQEDLDWQFDIICVYLSQKENKALVKFIKDIIL